MDTFPKCSVCHQEFTLKGPVPYLLPCLHAVCEKCVTSAAVGVISCSTCQREVNLTDTSLQKDAVRQKEIFHLTVKHRPTEILCTHENDGNQAVCWCQECEEFLCEYCQNLHNGFKATRRHVVETFRDTGDMFVEQVCKLHNRYPLEYFDKNCNISICAKCRLGEHSEHDVEDLDLAADAAKGRIEQHGKNVTAHHTCQQAYLKSVSKVVNDTKNTSSALKEAIHHTFLSLRTQLDQREKELVIDLENQTKQELSKLHTIQATSEGESKRCKWTSDYIRTALRYASNSDFLTLESSIQDTAKTHLRSVPPETHSAPAASFNTGGLEKLKSYISDFGSVNEDGSAAQAHTLADQGTQTDDSHLTDLDNKYKDLKVLEVADDPTPLASFDAGDKTYTLKTGTKTPVTLKCPKLQLDAARANTDYCHVTTDGELVNSRPATRHRDSGRLRRYHGTCSSTPIPLPPPPSNVTPAPHTPRYWETHSRVGVVGGGWRPVVLEMGVGEESQVDSGQYVREQRCSWCVCLERCLTHRGSLCTCVCQPGERGKCYRNTMSATRGTQATLHYGVVLDVGRGRLAFIDLDREIVLAKLDVEWRESLLPMFSLGLPDICTVNMKLVSGVDITMTDSKKSLIYNALT
ncbi:transcription intermediary factor 1-beta-like [Haliotis rufescens]|uniref:transcription intermediary factor 1-beta-like n=1 Tax=Haliotis rufescens TaxID=6454 RepID=UPI00201F2695|nr:transcription intermediary factor 1-beta-like [Haliotis rufescens]XP_048258267.1 transcription intermediary factor 1-beta-like [Haliotis rufescens]